MVLTIDTEAKTVTVQGFTTTIEEAKHWARIHELDGYEVDFPKHWAHGLPHEEKIKELEQSMFKYECIEGEDGKIEHVVTFDPFNSSYYLKQPLTNLVILPNPESDAPKIDLDKGKKYTLEVGEVGEVVLVRGLSKENIEAGWYLHPSKGRVDEK